jgi:transposase
MARMRRQFTAEFKAEAVRLVDSGRAILDVARSLGIRADMLRQWQRQFVAAAAPTDPHAAFPGHGQLASQDEELRRLRRENAVLRAVLREEREILKKATAFFAKESR